MNFNYPSIKLFARKFNLQIYCKNCGKLIKHPYQYQKIRYLKGDKNIFCNSLCFQNHLRRLK